MTVYLVATTKKEAGDPKVTRVGIYEHPASSMPCRYDGTDNIGIIHAVGDFEIARRKLVRTVSDPKSSHHWVMPFLVDIN